MEFTLIQNADGTGMLTHQPSQATLRIAPDDYAMLVSANADYDSEQAFEELAADLMIEADVLAYDDFSGEFDTPDNIYERARDAAIAYEQDRGLLAWYHGRVV